MRARGSRVQTRIPDLRQTRCGRSSIVGARKYTRLPAPRFKSASLGIHHYKYKWEYPQRQLRDKLWSVTFFTENANHAQRDAFTGTINKAHNTYHETYVFHDYVNASAPAAPLNETRTSTPGHWLTHAHSLLTTCRPGCYPCPTALTHPKMVSKTMAKL